MEKMIDRSSLRSTVVRILALVFVLPAFATGKNKHEKWLTEEVVWIASQKEQARFLTLKSDEEKEQFIQEFWQRRDPSPSTTRNEYKEEHYRRLQFANRHFREGIPGWKADRGRVYIIHGQPDNESFFNSRSEISADRVKSSTTRSPNTIVWTYQGNPLAKYYRGKIQLIFQPSSGLNRQSFVLSESATGQQRAEEMSRKFFPASDANWLEADVRYKLVMAGPPAIVNSKGADLPNSGLREFARYVEDILRSPGDVLEESALERERREKSRRELNESVQTQVTFQSFNFVLKSGAYRRTAKDWFVPIEIDLPVAELTDETVDIYAALIDPTGRIYDEFIDSLTLDRALLQASGQETLSYSNSFSAQPGVFEMKVVVREISSKRMALQTVTLALTSAAPDGLTLSSLLLTNRVEVLPEDVSKDDLSGEGILFNQVRLFPSRTHRFQRNNHVFLYLQMWLPDASPAASMSANFIKDGEIVRRLDPRKITPMSLGFSEFGTSFSLADFEPGKYTLQIHAIDPRTKTYDIKRTTFEIDPSLD